MEAIPLSPSGIAPPAARYAHAMLVTGASRWLHTSGIVPVSANGIVPAGIALQAATVWANLNAILAEAGMGAEHVVSVSTFVVASASHQLNLVMTERDRALGGRSVASTLIVVAALAKPEWLVEISLVAAA